ncbi:MAG: hypothetical protein GF308_13505 [Candidatus Heimdallarchaeota archaeon]|nr:hypothetical protein [Candidatus Heimdallarchaeota archaeon]
MNNKTRKATVIDTGVLIEYLTIDPEKREEQKYKEYLETQLFKNKKYERFVISFLTRTELLYIHCRMNGWKKAKQYVGEIVKNLTIIRTKELDDLAAMIKCQLPIALVDCYGLAIGWLMNIPVYFVEEKELTEQLRKTIREKMNIEINVVKKL